MKPKAAMPIGAISARILVLVACLLLAAQAFAGNRYALLVGLNQYRDAIDVIDLKYAVDDAKALADRLSAAGFEVRVLTNEHAMRRDILGELQRYASKLRNDDMFLLFFAGHGVRRPWGQPHTYWLTYDADLSFLDNDGIRLNHLMEYVQDIQAGRKVVLLDHCFSGDIGQGPVLNSNPVEVNAAKSVPGAAGGAISGSRGPSSSFGLVRAALPETPLASQLQLPKGIAVMAAAGAEAFELEDLKHGIFTEALLQALESRVASEGKESLTLGQLTTFVKKKVRELSKEKQEFSSLTNGFIAKFKSILYTATGTFCPREPLKVV